ncbi:MAG: substrate-binding domain-containing protein [Solirubrobacteraceae bacterium]
MLRDNTLRERRRKSGLTQAELASRAQVSRQLVAAVEAGRHAPAVDAAIRLAGVLGASVEALFIAPAPEVVPALGERVPEGRPLRLGRVGERTIAMELADHGISGAGWAKADATVQEGRLRRFAAADPTGLVLAGCEPAFGLAERMLEGLGKRSLMTISAATGSALTALARERVHAAVVHGLPGQLPQPPVPVCRWHVARWSVGLAVTRRLRGESLEALLSEGLPIAQRDPAAASQQGFDRALRATGLAVRPRGPQAAGHLDAARIAATLDGAGVSTEAAAYAFDLAFLPFEQHVVELWAAESWRDHPGLEALGDLLGSAAFIDRLTLFGGYDLTGCGDVRTGPT